MIKTTKIIIRGTSFMNKGSAAMLISTTKMLKYLIPDAEFAVASPDPKFDSQRGLKHGLRFFNGRYSHYDLNLLLAFVCMLRELMKADLVINLSGLSFTDQFGKLDAIIPSLDILQCKLLRKPIVMYSQSMGPFNSRVNRLLAKLFLARANMIVARGEKTRQYLHEIGIEKQVYIYTDSSFILQPAPMKRVNRILLKEHIEREGELLIGISVNTRIYERCNSQKAENRYVELIAQVVDNLIEKLKAKVVFMPNEVKESGYDDRFVARKIYKMAKNKPRIKLVENEYSPEELKAVIGIFDLFIGCRFHSIIASTSMLVPTIAIAWGHKYYETMETLGQEKYVCDYKITSPSQLTSLAEDALARREEIKKELKVLVEKAKQDALENAKLVKDLLDSLGGSHVSDSCEAKHLRR